MLLLAVCLMAPMATADTNKQLEKALNKEKKEKMKEYKKRGLEALCKLTHPRSRSSETLR